MHLYLPFTTTKFKCLTRRFQLSKKKIKTSRIEKKDIVDNVLTQEKWKKKCNV